MKHGYDINDILFHTRESDGKKVYWETRGKYIKIFHTGMLVKIENAERVIEKLFGTNFIQEWFIDGI